MKHYKDIFSLLFISGGFGSAVLINYLIPVFYDNGEAGLYLSIYYSILVFTIILRGGADKLILKDIAINKCLNFRSLKKLVFKYLGFLVVALPFLWFYLQSVGDIELMLFLAIFLSIILKVATYLISVIQRGYNSYKGSIYFHHYVFNIALILGVCLRLEMMNILLIFISISIISMVAFLWNNSLVKWENQNDADYTIINSFYFISIITYFYSGIDVSLSGMFLEPSEVVIYSVISKVNLIIAAFLVISNFVLAPWYANLFKDNLEELIEVCRSASTLLISSALVTVPLIYLLLYYYDQVIVADIFSYKTGMVLFLISSFINVSVGGVIIIYQMISQERQLLKYLIWWSVIALISTLFSLKTGDVGLYILVNAILNAGLYAGLYFGLRQTVGDYINSTLFSVMGAFIVAFLFSALFFGVKVGFTISILCSGILIYFLREKIYSSIRKLSNYV